jgi:predicted nucleic-acid-binding Zn-ribbon protein
MNRIMDCPICGGDDYHVSEGKERRAGILVDYTRGTCADCGWFETDQSRIKKSGFKNLDDLNDLRYSLSRGDLTPDEFALIRIRINGPRTSFNNPSVLRGQTKVERDTNNYNPIINRRWTLHE